MSVAGQEGWREPADLRFFDTQVNGFTAGLGPRGLCD
jgi:hypothetical protein